MSVNSDTIREALMSVKGQLVDETGIYYEGTRRVIPEVYRENPMVYVDDLRDSVIALNEGTQVTRKLTYRPWDVAAIMEDLFKDKFGVSLASVARGFGSNIDVIVDHKGTIKSVPWGRFDVAFLNGSLELRGTDDERYGLVTTLIVRLPLRFRDAAQNFLDMVQEEMKLHSIYRGKAISGGEVPDFMDTTKLDPTSVIYTAQVMAELEAHVWSRIRYRGVMGEDGIDFNRKVVVYGPWGTGKTLLGELTAQIAVAHGVTYVYGRSGDSLDDLMQVARLYQPSVVFVEDADNLPANDVHETSALLELFDGLDAKHKDVMVVATTNHIERIPAGMLRPGRLDHIIRVDGLDDESRERFVRRFLSEDLIDPELDMAQINVAMAGYPAAYVREAVLSAVWYSRSQNEGKRPTVITTKDLVHSANGLRGQYDLHLSADETTEQTDVGTVLSNTIRAAVEAVANQQVLLDYDGDVALTVSTDDPRQY